MQTKHTTKREIVWMPDSDRHIAVWWINDEISGINYCQGDCIEDIFERYNEPDVELTAFYMSVVDLIRFKTGNLYDQIDHAIWMHWDFQQNKLLVEGLQD